MNVRALACLSLVLAWVAAPLHAQSSVPGQSAPAGANRPPDAARAARKAQLMAEFRALLEQTQARQEAQASTAANPAMQASNGLEAPGQEAVMPSANMPSTSMPSANQAASAPTRPAQAPAPRWPKDPALDYTGQACEYFTRPPLGQSTLPVHPEGRWVAYGERMYQCVNQRWRLAGPVAAYADGEQRQAELLER